MRINDLNVCVDKFLYEIKTYKFSISFLFFKNFDIQIIRSIVLSFALKFN